MQSLLNDFVQQVESLRLNLHGIMVTQAGMVVGKHYWIADTSHELRSISKSFTSCAIGIAASEGQLALNDKVVGFFASQLPPTMDKRMQELSIRHLLMMAHGRDEAIMMSPQRAQIIEPDWVRFFLGYPITRAPGEKFVYDTGASYMLSAILQEVTGQTLRTYLMDRLFEPLNIDNPRWDICPMGRTLGGAGLHLSVAEICRFGNLLLNKGHWEGTQLVPHAYLVEATTKQIETGQMGAGIDWTLGYGFQFWLCRHGAFRADGTDSQFCIVLPAQKAVVAITAQERKMQTVLDTVWQTVLPHLN